MRARLYFLDGRVLIGKPTGREGVIEDPALVNYIAVPAPGGVGGVTVVHIVSVQLLEVDRLEILRPHAMSGDMEIETDGRRPNNLLASYRGALTGRQVDKSLIER